MCSSEDDLKLLKQGFADAPQSRHFVPSLFNLELNRFDGGTLVVRIGRIQECISGEYMETVVLLVVVLAVGYVLKSGPRSRPQPGKYRPATKRKPEYKPFSEKHARHPAEKTVVEGPARIVDGDTLVIRKTQIRLFGVDAPEMNHPHGIRAKWALVSLTKGKTVRAEVTDVDAYGRTVARCYLTDGRDLSAEMVKLGLAIDWPKFSGGVYRSMEVPDARKKLWLADARQKGRMHVWKRFEERQKHKAARSSAHRS